MLLPNSSTLGILATFVLGLVPHAGFGADHPCEQRLEEIRQKIEEAKQSRITRPLIEKVRASYCSEMGTPDARRFRAECKSWIAQNKGKFYEVCGADL